MDYNVLCAALLMLVLMSPTTFLLFTLRCSGEQWMNFFSEEYCKLQFYFGLALIPTWNFNFQTVNHYQCGSCWSVMFSYTSCHTINPFSIYLISSHPFLLKRQTLPNSDLLFWSSPQMSLISNFTIRRGTNYLKSSSNLLVIRKHQPQS